MTLESYGPDAPTSTGNVLTGNLDTVWLLSHHLYYQRKDDELSAMSFLYRALEAACAAYASLNLSLLHYITLHTFRRQLNSWRLNFTLEHIIHISMLV